MNMQIEQRNLSAFHSVLYCYNSKVRKQSKRQQQCAGSCVLQFIQMKL